MGSSPTPGTEIVRDGAAALGRDPDRIGVVEIVDAVVRDPALETARRARNGEHRSARVIAAMASRDVPEAGQTLRELASQPAHVPPAAARVPATKIDGAGRA